MQILKATNLIIDCMNINKVTKNISLNSGFVVHDLLLDLLSNISVKVLVLKNYSEDQIFEIQLKYSSESKD